MFFLAFSMSQNMMQKHFPESDQIFFKVTKNILFATILLLISDSYCLYLAFSMKLPQFDPAR